MDAKQGTPQRRLLVNYLLQPLVQLRLGMVNLGLCMIFLLALGTYVYNRFVQFAEVVSTLTQADDQVSILLSDYLSGVGTTVLFATVLFVVVNLLASIYITHRLVGPTVAFRRHIRGLMDGNFTVKTTLRRNDAFNEVAEDLNRLSERLGQMTQVAGGPDHLGGINAPRSRRPG